MRELTRKGSAEHELRSAIDTICAARAARSLSIFVLNYMRLLRKAIEELYAIFCVRFNVPLVAVMQNAGDNWVKCGLSRLRLGSDKSHRPPLV